MVPSKVVTLAPALRLGVGKALDEALHPLGQDLQAISGQVAQRHGGRDLAHVRQLLADLLDDPDVSSRVFRIRSTAFCRNERTLNSELIRAVCSHVEREEKGGGKD
jgi:hypothetical protein